MEVFSPRILSDDNLTHLYSRLTELKDQASDACKDSGDYSRYLYFVTLAHQAGIPFYHLPAFVLLNFREHSQTPMMQMIEDIRKLYNLLQEN